MVDETILKRSACYSRFKDDRIRAMEQQQGQNASALFTLRIWQVREGGKMEWRGRIQHVLSGEVYYFRSWQMLIERLTKILTQGEMEDPNTEG